MKKKLIRDLMTSNIKTIDSSKSIFDASKLMSKNNIGAIVCIEKDGTTAGIFTERDLLKKVVAAKVKLSDPVSKVMTKDLITVQLHDDLDKVPEMMLKCGFRHIPIMDGVDLVGILSIKDILKYVMRSK